LHFERTAIGEHLLLGGDNLDFALARRVEESPARRAASTVSSRASSSNEAGTVRTIP
jgi:hypothetical protein